MHRYITRLRTFIPAGALAGLAACSSSVPLLPVFPARLSTASISRIEPAIVVPTPAAVRTPEAREAGFTMPAHGRPMAWFNGSANPGIDFAGRPGDPVFASRDGRVVLVSSALPAYGTMIVLKHDDTFITAYAHLGRTLVRENDEVIQGQQIADLALPENDQVALHFEIRKMGVAVDPALYLQGLAH